MFSRILNRLLGKKEHTKSTSTDMADALAKLEIWVQRQQRNCWKPVVVDAENVTSKDSRFGGVPWLVDGEPWPRCGTCHEEMSHFLQLDLAALPEGFDHNLGDGFLQMFYCTESCGREEWEPFDSGHLIRVTKLDTASVPNEVVPKHTPLAAKRIVRWEPVPDYPSGEDFEENGFRQKYDFVQRTVVLECDDPSFRIGPISISDSNIFDETFGAAERFLCHAGDKLGGWPNWVQGPELPNCPTCGRQMKFIFQIDSEDNVPFMFGDMGIGHISYCPDHPDIFGFGWACS